MKLTTQLTKDHEPVYLFFIDGALELTESGVQQKGYKTEKQALKEGIKKMAQIKKANKR